MSLSSYLAEKYLTASNTSSNPSKKRKRKHASASNPPSGLIIADDDAPGWTNSNSAEQDDDDTPIISSSTSAEFRKAKKSAWKTVGVPALQPKDEDAAADRIIQQAAAENSAALHADEEPVFEDDGVVKMGDGTHAGLQSAAAVSAQMEKRRREEAAQWERESGGAKGKKKGESTEETVYRDATGRRIDISMRRNEAKRELDEKARKEAEELEKQKGDVQLAARAKRREDLDEAKYMTVARGVDDVEMNEELKQRDRWDDPALAFLVRGEGKGKSVSGKPLYKGAAPPNRWDGVDRGNGWEAERFKGENRRTRNKELDFQWQMDE
ncbi:pre-mRNA-splicing factor cwc26 protein [Rutstroemia sp. NJR-2017a WRK4]|nr:pre-mRNA-splicing factor cwc26 protein [Rutstroemia sp. NJR-2017a WRK4]